MKPAPDKGQKTQALYALHWMPGLSPSARRVAAWLVWHANGATGRCDPGQVRLMAETGLSERTVRYAVKELIEVGIVARELRGTQSSTYQIRWGTLAETVSGYEKAAREFKTGQTGRGKNVPHGGAETCPSKGQEIAPKLSEINPGDEPMFRVGTALKSSASKSLQNDNPASRKILSTKTDEAFLAVLDRELAKGALFDRQTSDLIYERLDIIFQQGEAHHGDPVAGRAYRLLETVICWEDAA